MLWKESFQQVRERVEAQLGYGKVLRLAQKSGVCADHLGRAWRGERSLSFSAAYRVAKAAGISMEDLYKTIAAPKDSFCRKELAEAEAKRKRWRADAEYSHRKSKKLAAIANQYKRTPTR